ncbi:MAG: DUF1844 domain-containing protein [Planctomycetes bacterium]|nr:DUF1844 domain-containing protein [Planctomycetota bacterium]
MAPDQPPAGGPAEPDRPRLHIDADWKRQAQEEKERLGREVEQARARPAPGPASGPASPGAAGAAAAAAGFGAGAAPQAGEGLPPPSFSTLVQTLATQAAIFMSDQADPETGLSLRNLDLAKHHIDLLRVLEEKTRGNLTEQEKGLLETVLYDLLMAYVESAG